MYVTIISQPGAPADSFQCKSNLLASAHHSLDLNFKPLFVNVYCITAVFCVLFHNILEAWDLLLHVWRTQFILSIAPLRARLAVACAYGAAASKIA